MSLSGIADQWVIQSPHLEPINRGMPESVAWHTHPTFRCMYHSLCPRGHLGNELALSQFFTSLKGFPVILILPTWKLPSGLCCLDSSLLGLGFPSYMNHLHWLHLCRLFVFTCLCFFYAFLSLMATVALSQALCGLITTVWSMMFDMNVTDISN